MEAGRRISVGFILSCLYLCFFHKSCFDIPGVDITILGQALQVLLVKSECLLVKTLYDVIDVYNYMIHHDTI